jgi:hypothetical protein
MSDGERLSANLLMKTTMGLPASLAASMRDALDENNDRIAPGSYDDGDTVCPLGAADELAEASDGDRFLGWSPRSDYGILLVRFARAFDLCAQQYGTERALRLLGVALSRRLDKAGTPLVA